MYVKVFESRQSKNSYVIQHDVAMNGLKHGSIHIVNQDKQKLSIGEYHLFQLIDWFFKDKFK